MGGADRLGRKLRDLRISVTDRCNLRCAYCMPAEVFGPEYPFLDRDELLTYEELTRLAGLFVGLGVGKVRITGGEPLLRRELPRFIAMLRGLEPSPDLAMTTNGLLLRARAPALAGAGLDRVSVSLDTLDDATFARLTSTRVRVEQVLDGIEAAARAGLGPLKVNTVVVRGVNDHQIVGIAEHFRGTGHIVRFIEYMDVGTTNGWRLDRVVPAAEVLEMIGERWPLEPVEPGYRGEVAERWRYRDGSGEVGVIASVTQPFCGACTRARISADGKLFTCLFATAGTDLRRPLRGGASDDEMTSLIAGVWERRDDRYSEERSAATGEAVKVEMSYIGG